MRRSVVSKLIRSTAKQRQVRINAEEKNLKTTQARNIEQFQSKNNKKLVDVGDDNSIDSFSLLVGSQVVSQAISRLFLISNVSRQDRKLVSDIWKHYELIENNSIKCNYCYTIYKLTGGTRVPRNYLTKKHRIDSVNRQAVVTTTYDKSIKIALLRLSEKEKERKDRQLNIDIAKKINKEHLEYLYIK
jgi:hypothetical protein